MDNVLRLLLFTVDALTRKSVKVDGSMDFDRYDKGVLEGYDIGRIDINQFKGGYASFIRFINNKNPR